MILDSPSAERGYEELARRYEECGMMEEAEALKFLVSEKFHAYGPCADPEQH